MNNVGTIFLLSCADVGAYLYIVYPDILNHKSNELNKIAFSLMILSFLPVFALAQHVYTLSDSSSFRINDYAVLPDRGYTIDQILADTTLPFVVNDSLRTLKEDACWIKIIIANPFEYAEKYSLFFIPLMSSTLYYYDPEIKKWTAQKAGIMAGWQKKLDSRSKMPLTLRANATNVLYIKTDLSLMRQFGYTFKPIIRLKKQVLVQDKEQLSRFGWLLAISVLFLFFANNLYVFYSFRDKAILYYLIAQLGGMIYITSYRGFFYELFPNPVFTFWMNSSPQIDYYDLNMLLQHIAILLLLYGYLQFTRSYLNTSRTLPNLDIALKAGWVAYLTITVCIVVINVGFFCLMHYTLLYENILFLLVTAVIMTTCIAGYLHKLRASGPFLLANMLPLIFIFCTTLFHILVGFHDNDKTFFPEFAIVAEALGFSIALVTRTKLLQNDLTRKEIEAKQLEFDLREIETGKKLIELENEKINADIKDATNRNELLKQNLEANQRELASTTLYIVQKNKLLADLKKQIQESNQLYPENKHQGLKGIQSILESNLYLDSDWLKFKLHFEQVHPNFFADLQSKYPALTKNEVRLHAYLHINLSTKEIAALLNVDPDSVRRAKSRLNKKMFGAEPDYLSEKTD